MEAVEAGDQLRELLANVGEFVRVPAPDCDYAILLAKQVEFDEIARAIPDPGRGAQPLRPDVHPACLPKPEGPRDIDAFESSLAEMGGVQGWIGLEYIKPE
jgi:hypothetical protein